MMAGAARQLLVDQVYRYLLSRLSARQLPIGTHLNALEIAESLSISRTTVNKAVLGLINAGFVKPDAGRRPMVIALPSETVAVPVEFAFANQTERTYESILNRLLRGDFQPGETVKERRLALDLNVNAVTVHRAAEWLCNDGLFVRLRRRGWQVATLRLEDLKDIYRVRLMLEPLTLHAGVVGLPAAEIDALSAQSDRLIAAGESATVFERRQADCAFHMALAQACNRPVLAETLEPLIRRAILNTTVDFRYGRVTACFTEHKSILAALRRRNVEQAKRLLKEHLKAAARQNISTWPRTEVPVTTHNNDQD
jgi:DNA-binding GntR family transcriptional regulator